MQYLGQFIVWGYSEATWGHVTSSCKQSQGQGHVSLGCAQSWGQRVPENILLSNSSQDYGALKQTHAYENKEFCHVIFTILESRESQQSPMFFHAWRGFMSSGDCVKCERWALFPLSPQRSPEQKWCACDSWDALLCNMRGAGLLGFLSCLAPELSSHKVKSHWDLCKL